jgi:hypothetical protein
MNKKFVLIALLTILSLIAGCSLLDLLPDMPNLGKMKDPFASPETSADPTVTPDPNASPEASPSPSPSSTPEVSPSTSPEITPSPTATTTLPPSPSVQAVANWDLLGGSNPSKPPTVPDWTFGIIGTWEGSDYDAFYYPTYSTRSGVLLFTNNSGGTTSDQVWIEQTVTVPLDANSLQVNASNTGYGAYPYQNNGVVQVLINGTQVATQSAQNIIEFTIAIDLSIYRGQNITIRVQHPQINSGYTIFFVDWIKIL